MKLDLNDKTKLNDLSNKICNHFMQNYEAKISHQDYEFVKNNILYYLLGVENIKIKPLN